jgi:hypothetical protein
MRDKPRDSHPVEFHQNGKPALSRVSALLLERYNLGEVTGAERARVESALAGDEALAERLRLIRQSDRAIRDQLRDRLRGASDSPGSLTKPRRPAGGKPKALPRRALVWTLCAFSAAALFLVVALPLYRGAGSGAAGAARELAAGDRLKGSADTAELRAYLKAPGEQAPLADQAYLRAGDTIQLAYTVNSQPGSRYGVIFSIDRRSTVTVHYPYRLGADTRLLTGRRIFLEEAYTLDDAPDYEVFFFVIAAAPLDLTIILDAARQLARNPETALEQGPRLFQNYELKTLILRKE